MKIIKIKLYKFQELSEEAKERVIEENRHINVDGEWWECVYEDFKKICSYLGIDVDTDGTYFSGFYFQGQGSSYTATVDVLKAIEGFKTEAWKEHAHLEVIDVHLPKFDHRVLNLIKRGIIGVYANVLPTNRETSVTIDFGYNYNNGIASNYNNIDRQLEQIEEFITDLGEELNNKLFSFLRNTYECETSDDSIREHLNDSDNDYTIDGKSCYSL